MMCGGLGVQTKDADGEVQGYCDLLKGAMIEKSGMEFEIFTVLKYKPQIVAGTNYFVKIQVRPDGNGNCIHARIFRPLPGQGEIQLHSVLTGKEVDDVIAHF